MSQKQQLIDSITDERARTTRFLEAFPAAESEFKPHPTSQAARELVHTLCVEAVLGKMVLDGTLDLANLKFPTAPATWDEVIKAYHGSYDALLAALAATSDADLAATTPFLTGPKAVGPVPKGAIVQFMLNDHIHHRGQLSVYLRMTGGKVPSIYGPSKDEPWN
jgi:uncharacterized damage-inducible protein DinB